MAEAAIESIEVPEGETPETYCLSSFFEPIVQKLLETTDRNDGAQHNLRSAAYEALMELIKNSPKVPHLTLLLPYVEIDRNFTVVAFFSGLLRHCPENDDGCIGATSKSHSDGGKSYRQ